MRAMPPTTPTMKIGRPAANSQFCGFVLRAQAADAARRRAPAMPAEIANTVELGEHEVHADGRARGRRLSFIASRRRPNGPRRSHATKMRDQRERRCQQHELPVFGVERVTEQFETGDAERAGPEDLDLYVGERQVERSEPEDPAIEEHRERGGREREVDAREPQRRQRDERADRCGDHERPDQTRSVMPPAPRCAIVIAPTPARAPLRERHLACEADRAGPSTARRCRCRTARAMRDRVGPGRAAGSRARRPRPRPPRRCNVPRIVGIGMISRVRAMPCGPQPRARAARAAR